MIHMHYMVRFNAVSTYKLRHLQLLASLMQSSAGIAHGAQDEDEIKKMNYSGICSRSKSKSSNIMRLTSAFP